MKAAGQTVKRILEAVAAVPGVESSAATFLLPGVPGTFPVELNVAEGRAESEPKIELGSGPKTRFNAIEAALGCWKRTDSLAAILKRVQSMIRRSVV